MVNGEKMETVIDFTFLGSKITVDGDWSHEIQRHSLLGKKMTNLEHVKEQRCHFADKDLCSQSYGFYRSHVGMWELDNRGGWVLHSNCDAGEWSWESLGLQGDQTSQT